MSNYHYRTEHTFTKRFFSAGITAAWLCLLLVACVGQTATPGNLPIVDTIEITQVVTHVVYSVVTRQVFVPITDTPSQTATPIASKIYPSATVGMPAPTTTVVPPRVTILVHSACLYGPGSAYLFKYGLNATVWMTVVGRNPDGTWLSVKAANDPISNACWIKSDLVRFDTGGIKDVPIVWTALPYSTLYQPPQAVSANRVNDEISIFWQPVYMTEDDYRGYLIEAWLCQGGRLVFQPVGYAPSFAENNYRLQIQSLMVLQVRDEPGCDVPSSARIYSVEKHGYTDYRIIHLPGFYATDIPDFTPTSSP